MSALLADAPELLSLLEELRTALAEVGPRGGPAADLLRAALRGGLPRRCHSCSDTCAPSSPAPVHTHPPATPPPQPPPPPKPPRCATAWGPCCRRCARAALRRPRGSPTWRPASWRCRSTPPAWWPTCCSRPRAAACAATPSSPGARPLGRAGGAKGAPGTPAEQGAQTPAGSESHCSTHPPPPPPPPPRRLVQLRSFVDRLAPVDAQLAYQVDKLLRATRHVQAAGLGGSRGAGGGAGRGGADSHEEAAAAAAAAAEAEEERRQRKKRKKGAKRRARCGASRCLRGRASPPLLLDTVLQAPAPRLQSQLMP
jgi:hypothetical protein